MNNIDIKNIQQFVISQGDNNIILPEDFIYYERLLIIIGTDNYIYNISKTINTIDFLIYNLITHHNNLGTYNLHWTIGSLFIQSSIFNNMVTIGQNSRITIYGINKSETNYLDLLKSKLVKIKNNVLTLLFYRNNDNTLSYIGHSCYGTNRIENSGYSESYFFQEFSCILENNKIRTTPNNINFSYYSTDISDFKFLD